MAFPLAAGREGEGGEGMKRLGEIGVERGKRRSPKAEEDSVVLMYSSRVLGQPLNCRRASNVLRYDRNIQLN